MFDDDALGNVVKILLLFAKGCSKKCDPLGKLPANAHIFIFMPT